MAKKKTIELNNAEPLRDLPTSGVMVSYKHQTIAASDETAEYALLTRGKKCEANIEVTYIRPAESNKFPFIIPINFDPSSPLNGTVAFDSDRSADVATALLAGRPICAERVESDGLIPISYMSWLWDGTIREYRIPFVRVDLFEVSEGAVTSLTVVTIDLRTNTWTASMKLFN